MATFVSPAVFATGTKPAEVRIRPVMVSTGTKPPTVRACPILLASGIKPDQVRVGPLLFATVSEDGASIQAECRADTLRSLSRSCRQSFDTVRFLQGRRSFDTQRILQRHLDAKFETVRNVRGLSVIPFDTCRVVLGPIEVSSDTFRDVQRSLSLSSGTIRIVETRVEVPSDTRRIVERHEAISFDAYRNVLGPIDVSFVTRRDVMRRFELSLDLCRLVQRHLDVPFDTCRLLVRRIDEGFSAVRLIPHRLGNLVSSGIQSVTMTLAESTLSDTFQVVAAFPVYPKDSLYGWLMDFPFRFQAEETREDGILFTVRRSMYDADKMLYTPLKYSLSGLSSDSYTNLSGKEERAVHARGHAAKIAAALDLNAVFRCGDFVPRDSYADTETTYQSVLSGIFGWTKNVPRMQVNIFIRDGNLVFLQRGHERGVVDLSGIPWFNHPVYDRKLVRTTWSREAEATDNDWFSSVKSGRMYWIDGDDNTPVPQDDGVETGYENVDSGGGRTDSRIRFTIRQNPDGTTTRADYEYIDTGTDYLLRQITEVTTFPSGEVYKTRITKYTYTRGGWRHMVVIENNEVVEESEEAMGGGGSEEPAVNTASAAWRGRPGDRSNEHMEQQVQLSHGASWKKTGNSTGDSFLPEVARDVPVLDYGTYRAYMRELEWMDRRIEEKVSLTITAPVRKGAVDPAGNHVMDFLDRYLLNGAEYYLVSNVVSYTPRSLKQSLTLVRWY